VRLLCVCVCVCVCVCSPEALSKIIHKKVKDDEACENDRAPKRPASHEHKARHSGSQHRTKHHEPHLHRHRQTHTQTRWVSNGTTAQHTPYMCPHTTCVLILLCFLILLHVSSYYYKCPHTTTCVSSYYYICVHILLCMCPHTTLYVSSYCYVYVLILLYMCPHTTINVHANRTCLRYTRHTEGSCSSTRIGSA
jgi:hypothetical protein